MLEHVARTISTSLRTGDTLGRRGGEAFLAILPDAAEGSTLQLAERCRILVRNTSVTVADGLISPTISVGATLLAITDTEDSLFRRLDKALYQSKNEGRDRTTFLAQ